MVNLSMAVIINLKLSAYLTEYDLSIISADHASSLSNGAFSFSLKFYYL